MQNQIVRKFDATACARSRCFESILRMENMISFGEATCPRSSQSVWIIRRNTVLVQPAPCRSLASAPTVRFPSDWPEANVRVYVQDVVCHEFRKAEGQGRTLELLESLCLRSNECHCHCHVRAKDLRVHLMYLWTWGTPWNCIVLTSSNSSWIDDYNRISRLSVSFCRLARQRETSECTLKCTKCTLDWTGRHHPLAITSSRPFRRRAWNLSGYTPPDHSRCLPRTVQDQTGYISADHGLLGRECSSDVHNTWPGGWKPTCKKW